MNVNELYSDISSFWDNIYPILLFHIALLLIYRFLFRSFSIKQKIKTYTESSAYANNKTLLENFELWKKLPFLLLIVVVVYFAVFNSLQSVITSVRIFPFEFSYSTTRFESMYEPQEDLITISSYGRDSTFELNNIEELKNKYLEEYKVKNPEKYESHIKWLTDTFSKYARYLNLTLLLLLVILVLFFRKISKRETKGKLSSVVRMVPVVMCILIVATGLRYKAEQAIEEQQVAEVRFVSALLAIDNNQRPSLSEDQIENVRKDLSERGVGNGFVRPAFWISDEIGESMFLQALFGERKLKIRTGSVKPYRRVSQYPDQPVMVVDTAAQFTPGY